MSNKKVKDLDALIQKTKSNGQSLYNKNRLLDIDLEDIKTIHTNKTNSKGLTNNLQETLNLTLNTKTTLNMNNTNYNSNSLNNKEVKFNKIIDMNNLKKEDK